MKEKFQNKAKNSQRGEPLRKCLVITVTKALESEKSIYVVIIQTGKIFFKRLLPKRDGNHGSGYRFLIMAKIGVGRRSSV